MKKICCGLTLYYPSEMEINNILKYCSMFKNVYIVDNTDNKNVEYLDILKNNCNITILSSGENLGLSKALNLLCDRAKDNNDFILLLDQDSKFDKKSIFNLIEFINTDKALNVSIYSPKIIYNHNEITCNQNDEPYEFVKWVITSGSCINLSYFSKGNRFDENYFIDRIEIDYGLRSISQGYNVVIVNSSLLYQSLGDCTNFYGFKYYQHSALRNYYIFRNRFYFYMFKDNGNKASNIIKLIMGSFLQICKIFLFNNNRSEKIRYILKAIVDIKNGKYGKY